MVALCQACVGVVPRDWNLGACTHAHSRTNTPDHETGTRPNLMQPPFSPECAMRLCNDHARTPPPWGRQPWDSSLTIFLMVQFALRMPHLEWVVSSILSCSAQGVARDRARSG